MYVDANVVLRYLLNDDQSIRSREIIEKNQVVLTVEVISEIVYVLSGVYKISRIEIRDTISCTYLQPALKALEYYSETNFDFVDCVLAGYSKIYNEPIATFDKKLEAFILKINT